MSQGFFFAHVGWLLKPKSGELVSEGEKISMKDLQGDWVVMLQKKFNWFFVIMMCWVLPGTSSLTQATCSTEPQAQASS
jgi:stearoyl-CoA desaturase (delta-9 desaturase)